LAGSRKQVMDLEVLDPAEVVGQLERILTTAVGQRAGLSIRSTPTPAIVGARGPLEQVLLNLVVNARDAAEPDGRIEVRVDSVTVAAGSPVLPKGAEPGVFVRISVEDDGAGVSTELQGRIFEPFFTTKGELGGTGLGLSVVRGVVEQHGGFIQLDSELGRGSLFTVYLPASRERATTKPVSGRRESRGGNEKVLVVDDDHLVLRLVCRTLERAGYQILPASGGAEALEILSSPAGAVDLVLSDLVMPVLGGRQLMDRAQAAGIHVPFLFFSGYSDGGVHRGFVLEKGVHFLAKPFTSDELARKVRQVLDQQHPRVREGLG
jgi:two-component system, cell cycle sensor histidine kinase and response regulator CckA